MMKDLEYFSIPKQIKKSTRYQISQILEEGTKTSNIFKDTGKQALFSLKSLANTISKKLSHQQISEELTQLDEKKRIIKNEVIKIDQLYGNLELLIMEQKQQIQTTEVFIKNQELKACYQPFEQQIKNINFTENNKISRLEDTKLLLILDDMRQDLNEVNLQIGRFYEHYEKTKQKPDLSNSNWGDQMKNFLQEFDQFLMLKNQKQPVILNRIWENVKDFNNPLI